MSDLDAMLDLIVTVAEIESGASLEMIQARGGNLAAARLAGNRSVKNIGWSEAEDAHLREWLGFLSEEEIGARLGRSAVAVHLRWTRDLRLPPPSKDPRYMTANRIANWLGVDAHKVIRWVDGGMLKGEVLPGERTIRRVRKDILLRWLLNPNNWIWFDPGAVANAWLRRMLARRAERWGDEWWNTNQVAAYHGVTVEDAKRYIKLGRIQGVQAANRGGRNDCAGWANWFVLRSEATRPGLYFAKGRGKQPEYSNDAAAFVLLARAVGCSLNAIEELTGWKNQTTCVRLQSLLQSGQAELLNEKYGLGISFRNGQIWADWRLHRDRFPRLAMAMDRFGSYLRGEYRYPQQRQFQPMPGIPEVVGVIKAAAMFRAESQAERRAAELLSFGVGIKPERLVRKMRDMGEWALDLLG